MTKISNIFATGVLLVGILTLTCGIVVGEQFNSDDINISDINSSDVSISIDEINDASQANITFVENTDVQNDTQGQYKNKTGSTPVKKEEDINIPKKGDVLVPRPTSTQSSPGFDAIILIIALVSGLCILRRKK